MTALHGNAHAKGVEKLKGHLAMLLFAALISGSFSIGHIAAPHIDPAVLTVARFVVATLAMGMIGFVIYRRLPIITDRLWRFPILGGLMAIYFVLMFVALQIAQPVTTGAVFTLVPLMSAVFGFLIVRQRPTPIIIASLLIGAAGAIWVIFKGDLGAILRFEIGRGEMIFFVGCIAHALYSPLVRKFNNGEAVFSFTFMTLVASTLWMFLWAVIPAWQTDWAGLPMIVWITIFYLGLFTTAGTFFLLQFASMRLPSSKVMAYGYLTPGIIVLYEWLLGHGFVSLSLLAGVLVIAGALIILALSLDG
ncbi:MAG: DMT family transporter [Pseudomonadota bacterium]